MESSVEKWGSLKGYRNRKNTRTLSKTKGMRHPHLAREGTATRRGTPVGKNTGELEGNSTLRCGI